MQKKLKKNLLTEMVDFRKKLIAVRVHSLRCSAVTNDFTCLAHFKKSCRLFNIWLSIMYNTWILHDKYTMFHVDSVEMAAVSRQFYYTLESISVSPKTIEYSTFTMNTFIRQHLKFSLNRSISRWKSNLRKSFWSLNDNKQLDYTIFYNV